MFLGGGAPQYLWNPHLTDTESTGSVDTSVHLYFTSVFQKTLVTQRIGR